MVSTQRERRAGGAKAGKREGGGAGCLQPGAGAHGGGGVLQVNLQRLLQVLAVVGPPPLRQGPPRYRRDLPPHVRQLHPNPQPPRPPASSPVPVLLRLHTAPAAPQWRTCAAWAAGLLPRSATSARRFCATGAAEPSRRGCGGGGRGGSGGGPGGTWVSEDSRPTAQSWKALKADTAPRRYTTSAWSTTSATAPHSAPPPPRPLPPRGPTARPPTTAPPGGRTGRCFGRCHSQTAEM